MTISSSPIRSKIPTTRSKPAGWATFDLKQRQKHGLETEVDADPFPPMPNITSEGSMEKLAVNNFPLIKPFSSVVKPSSDFPILRNDFKVRVPTNNFRESIGTQNTEESSLAPIIAKLKQLHSWANDSLVEDILKAVNNDEEQASAFLTSMVSSSGPQEPKKGPQQSTFISENNLGHENIEFKNEAIQLEIQPSECTVAKEAFGHFFLVPNEPEWEDDDVYLRHRKEALKMMRSASQHSRAASNAFLRGDHFSAQQFSSKARADWRSAEKLNAKAAKEIFFIRNGKSDLWKLDMHGLHATEAIIALKERLHTIETQMPIKHSVSSDGLNTMQTKALLPPVDSTSVSYMDANLGKNHMLSTPRQSTLQVITGTGNHSRGQASLPTAVKSFLIENGYRFDDARPGVFAVRPKFRQGLYANS